MSVQALTCAIALRGVSSSEKLLLMVLANYANEKMQCWPSQRRLSEDTCLSDRTIRSLLTELEERGVVSRRERQRDDGSRGTDVITLHFSGEVVAGHAETISGGAEVTSGGAEIDRGGMRKPFPGGAEVTSALTTFEPSTEPSVEPPPPPEGCGEVAVLLLAQPAVLQAKPKRQRAQPTAAEMAAFDAFWAVYPLKKGKKEALDAFINALCLGASTEALMRGATAYAGERAGKDPTKTKHAQGWLNGERWLDEPACMTGQVINYDAAAAGRRPTPRDEKLSRMLAGAVAAADRRSGP